MAQKLEQLLPNWNNKGKKVAYFCMEYAIDQSLKIYSGGLGFLAGSHLRTAYDQNRNMIGIGVLWKHGYYDQERNEDRTMKPSFINKEYSFLEDTGIVFPLLVHNSTIYVKAFLLKPDTFGSAPLFLLSTDIPENDYLSRTITQNLYDENKATRVAQAIVLGLGGARLLELLDWEPDIYHMNEGHALPLTCYLYKKHRTVEEVKKRVVFTTHTPEPAGNETFSLELLTEMNYFNGTSEEQAKELLQIENKSLNVTLGSLRMCSKSNAVSKIHEKVANEMWNDFEGTPEIFSITNAQNKKYWQDPELKKALDEGNNEALLSRKRKLKKDLLRIVADQTGKLFKPDVLTVVWARRFTGYKRANLILRDYEEFFNMVTRRDRHVQMIWAGKPYPKSSEDINLFNELVEKTRNIRWCAVLTGYELSLSHSLKKGADVWLNTPIYGREASGTSGMTAAMNGAVNVSTPDGWIPEFVKPGHNGFLIPLAENNVSPQERDKTESTNLFRLMENEIIPAYYETPERWVEIMKNGMNEVIPYFDSGRMLDEYYGKLYN